MTLTARVPTENGSRYLQQLCKLWPHKFEMEFDAQQGSFAFPMDPLRMAAEPDALIVTIVPNEDTDADRFKQVVAELAIKPKSSFSKDEGTRGFPSLGVSAWRWPDDAHG